MKKFNVRFAATLLLGVIVVPAIAYVLWHFQVNRNASNLLGRANTLRDDGDFREAIRLQERYLAYRPQDTEQLCTVALDYLQLIETDKEIDRLDIGRAYGRCEEALRQVPENHELRKQTVDFMIEVRRYSDAIEHLELMRDTMGDDFDSDSLVKLSRCKALNGDPNAARRELEQLLGFDPLTNSFDDEKAKTTDNVDAYLVLAALFRDDFDTELAEQVIDHAVEVNSGDYEAHLQRAKSILRYSTADERIEKAKVDIDKALELNPDDEQVILTAAQIAIADEDLETAKTHLDRGVEKHPESVSVFTSRSDLALVQKNAEEAMNWLLQGLDANPESPILTLKKCELELRERNVDAAEESLALLRSMGARTDWVNYLEVRLLLIEEKWRKASRQMEKTMTSLLARNPQLTSQVYIILAQCYENLEAWDLAISAAESVPDNSPQQLSAVLIKARSFKAKGQFAQAITNYRIIYDSQLEAGEEATLAISFSLFSLLTAQQAILPEAEQDWTESKKVLRYIAADENVEEPRKWAAYAELLSAQKKYEEALALVRKQRKKSPDDETLKIFERQLADKLGETEDNFDEKFNSPRERLLLASKIVRKGGDGVKEALVAQEEGIEAWSVKDQIRLKYGLVSLHRGLNLPAGHVRRLLLEISEADPQDMKCRTQLFTLGLIVGDEEQMGIALQMIEELEGTESNEWKLVQAQWLTWSFSNKDEGEEVLQEARNLMRDIQENRPNWTDLLRLQAQVSILLGDRESAEDYMNRIIDSGHDDPKIIETLAELYLETNRPEAARKMIARLPKTMRSKLADQKLIDLKTEHVSIADIEKVVPLDSEEAADLLWKGTALSRHGHLQAATHAFRRVTELKPRSPDGWLALVENLFKVREYQAAEDAMRNAQINLSETFVHVTLARCHELASSLDRPKSTKRSLHIARAEQFYQQALANSPDNRSVLQKSAAFYVSLNRRTSALQQLDRLLEGVEDYDADADQLSTWARRSKAGVLAGSGSFQDYLEAVEEIRKNVPKGERLAPDDLKILAQITLTRTDTLSHKKVIQDFEGLEQERKLLDNEQILLANLYQRVGRHGDSEKVLYDLLAAKPGNVQVVSLLIEMLIKQKKVDQAQGLLRKLPENSAQHIRVSSLVMAENGEGEKAEKQLLRLLPDPISRLPQESNEILLSVSSLLEEIKRYSTAERILREYVRRVPRRSLMLASFLGRQEGLEKLDQALSLCERGLKKKVFPLKAVTEVTVAALRRHLNELNNHDGRDQYFNRIDAWFQQGSEELTDSHTMVLQLAEFETMRGNTTRVVILYREFLGRPDLLPLHRAIVQNNLAYVLALEEKGEESLELVEEAIQHLGPTGSLLDTRAMAKIAVGRYPEARNDLNRAIDEGETAAFRFHMAYAQSLDRNPDEAESELRQAIELGLKPYQLHPVERAIYQRLIQDLGLESLALN